MQQLDEQEEERRIATEQYMKEHAGDGDKHGLGAVISRAIQGDESQQQAAVTAGAASSAAGLGLLSDHFSASDVVRLGQFVVTSGGAALLEGGNFSRVTSGRLVSLRPFGASLPLGAEASRSSGFGQLPLTFYFEATLLICSDDDDGSCVGVCSSKFRGSNKKGVGVGSDELSWGIGLDGSIRHAGRARASTHEGRLAVGDVIGVRVDARGFDTEGVAIAIYVNGDLVKIKDDSSTAADLTLGGIMKGSE